MFSPIVGTALSLAPAFTGILAIGTTTSGELSGLSIPVFANQRLLLFASITSTGLSLSNTVVGNISSGVAIS